MTFTGGYNRPNSVWFRTQVRHPWARLHVDRYKVEIADVNPIGRGHDPYVWEIASGVEFNRQKLRGSSWVGLRGAGERDWIWFRPNPFQTQALDEVCTALSAAGAHQVVLGRLQPMEIFPVRPFGSVAMMLLGTLMAGIGMAFSEQTDITVFAVWMRNTGLFAVLFGFVIGIRFLINFFNGKSASPPSPHQ